ncbi:MAG: nucleotidyltransferase domain-containing protein [Pseudomonadales bacterium]
MTKASIPQSSEILPQGVPDEIRQGTNYRSRHPKSDFSTASLGCRKIGRDVIEYPIVDEIDCNGWDIRKALYLLTRTNGALLEWLRSPIRYIEFADFAELMRTTSVQVMSPIALCYHYSHMARTNAREYLFRDQVRLKKYFYVLRPLLAIRHVEKHGSPPPVEFSKLADDVLPKNLSRSVEALLELKQSSGELEFGDQIPEINAFIEEELERHGQRFTGQDRPLMSAKSEAYEQLNRIFRSAIRP